jgi:hypothetical protein
MGLPVLIKWATTNVTALTASPAPAVKTLWNGANLHRVLMAPLANKLTTLSNATVYLAGMEWSAMLRWCLVLTHLYANLFHWTNCVTTGHVRILARNIAVSVMMDLPEAIARRRLMSATAPPAKTEPLVWTLSGRILANVHQVFKDRTVN